MIFSDTDFIDQALAQIFAETRRMSLWDADVFVQVKHFHAAPVDSGEARQSFEKLKLRCAGRGDNARETTLLRSNFE